MTPRATTGRKLLLAGFGVVVALAAVGAVELALRLAGFGGRSPMLHELELPGPVAGVPPGSRLYEIHPRLAELFFARAGPGGAEFVGGHRRELVVMPKPPGALRVVLAGASTIEGFPMPRQLTAARFLEAMLRHVVPDRKVEVLNLGVTAVASFPIRKIAIEAIERLEPDVVVLYEAHNEYFGASGVASYQSMGRSPAFMELAYRVRQLALSQAIDALGAGGASDSSESPARRENLIEVMASVPPVPPEGELRDAARASLVENFRAVVRAGRERGVPVVLSTVVGLERDLVPVGSAIDDLSPERRESFAQELDAARAEIESGAPGAATAATLARLAAEAPRHAEAAYWSARAFEASGRGEEASELYRRARDLDTMPWRASRALNAALRELAVAEGAPLADGEREFAAASAEAPAPGATTWALFADHVHPNLEGQALLARVLLDTLMRERLVPADPALLASLPAPRAIAARLGANDLELYAASHTMLTLFRAPPFGPHNRAAAERLERLLDAYRAQAGPVERAALRLWEESSGPAGFALPISWFGGIAALRAGDLDRARLYLHGAEASALPYGDERAAAQLLRVVVAIAGREESASVARRIEAGRREAEQVAALPGQPSALLARVLAGYRYLAGDATGGAALAAESARLAATAPTWQRPYLAGLPEPASLAPFGATAPRPAAASGDT